MDNFEYRILPFVRTKIENDEEAARARAAEKKKEALLSAYEQVDRIFGKPLSALSCVTILTFRSSIYGKEIEFAIDAFKFRYVHHAKILGNVFLHTKPDRDILYVKSKKWYRGWYNTFYSATRFVKLIESGKI